MADILPIRPWRYNKNLSASIDSLTSSIAVVLSEKQRNELYQNPYNSIHLSLPQQPNASERAARLLQEWKREGILIQDEIPAIYVYYQYFSLAGSPEEYCRKGFMCQIRVYDWSENVILRYENTIPNGGIDRTELLEKTELLVRPTHGLYTDTGFQLESYMDEAITDPLYESKNTHGVRDVLAVIHDASIIQKFISVLEDKPIILAEGNLLYESSLIHMKKQMSIHPGHTRKLGYNFNLMYLTNTEASDFKILPIHRLIKNIPNFNETEIVEKLAEDFMVKPVEDMETLPEIIAGKIRAFGIMFAGNAYEIHLKPESFSKLKRAFPEEAKRLDLIVMHYFIIEKILGIPEKTHHQSDNLEFERSFSTCLNKVTQGEIQMAIIANEVTIENVKSICYSGFTMPQQSTYFYPDLITGFLFTSIQESEFALPFYAPF